ncbi:hypothetical protein L7F22_020103 [Adiantum nelumboides]|nr:hypothetical protein [Adiantum nelumboides]
MSEIGRAREAIEELAAGDDLPLVLVNEAQLICVPNPVHGPFQSDMPDSRIGIYEKTPLAKPVVEALYNAKISSQHRVVFAGTGFTLFFRRNECSSALAKPISEDDQYSAFVGWKSPEDMVAYARGILNVDERVESIIKDNIFPWFRGRFRPFATLLEEVVLRGEDIGSVWKYVMDGLTNDKMLPGNMPSCGISCYTLQ